MLVATLLGRVAAELTAQDGLLLYCAAFAAQATAWSLAPTRSRAPARSSPRPQPRPARSLAPPGATPPLEASPPPGGPRATHRGLGQRPLPRRRPAPSV